MIRRLYRIWRKALTTPRRLGRILKLPERVEELKILNARSLIAQTRARTSVNSLADVEFRVFSQFGDDGIIQYLIDSLDIGDERRTFVEFGVEDYEEANTRFLLMNDNWSGLVLDSSRRNIKRIVDSHYYWRYDLKAVNAFVTPDNVNEIIGKYGFQGEVGLLSIDIDGNDFWVWEKLRVITPSLVIVEYNSTFGSQHAVSVPYAPAFDRRVAHFSNLYWGCSLRALCVLAMRKGYRFIGSNCAGNNAYFVRADRLGSLEAVTPERGFREAKFRESRSRGGALTYLPVKDRLRMIENMDVVDVETGEKSSISEIYGLR